MSKATSESIPAIPAFGAHFSSVVFLILFFYFLVFAQLRIVKYVGVYFGRLMLANLFFSLLLFL